MFITYPRGLRYVSRGDLAANDFSGFDLAQDGAWHTLNLSTIVPASAKLVLVRFGGYSTSLGEAFNVKAAGYTNNINMRSLGEPVANQSAEAREIFECIGQAIQYQISFASWDSRFLTICGWFE